MSEDVTIILDIIQTFLKNELIEEKFPLKSLNSLMSSERPDFNDK